VNIAFDLHEASPEYPVINAVVAHERAMDVAAEAVMNLQLEEIQFGLETSPVKLRGLSHREWGDATSVLAILMETSNPAQGRLRGATSAQSVLDGRDKMYKQAALLGRLFVPFDDAGHPIDVRIARHITAINEIMSVYNKHRPEGKVVLGNLQSYNDIVNLGAGNFL
jgi:hypothetical protein